MLRVWNSFYSKTAQNSTGKTQIPLFELFDNDYKHGPAHNHYQTDKYENLYKKKKTETYFIPPKRVNSIYRPTIFYVILQEKKIDEEKRK